MSETMTRAEREDLQRLIRQREKVQKSAAKERSAQLLADFENQMGTIYAADDDEVWKEATKIAEREVAKAQKQVEARCRELGMAKQFAPSIFLGWSGRAEATFKERRNELRKMAQSRIEAIERAAILEIEKASVDAQTQLALAGLTSDAARLFLEKLPTIESLMPALSFAELAGEAEPPVVEQLVSPNALRQRRFRERQAALRSASAPLLDPSRDGAADEGAS
jgi:hypothetical protein